MLDQIKINRIQAQLKQEEDDLFKRREGSKKSSVSLEETACTMAENQELQAMLGEIVTRHLESLPGVRRRVFVSTQFDCNRANDWVRGVIDMVQTMRQDQKLPQYDFQYGESEGLLFRREIVRRIIGCHYFLSIVMRESEAHPGISLWLAEELACAALLPKLMCICVEQGIPQRSAGNMVEDDLVRLVFDRRQPDSQHDLARRILIALDAAPENQRRRLQEKRDVWSSVKF